MQEGYYNYEFDSSGRIAKKSIQDGGQHDIEIEECSYHENGNLKSKIVYSTEKNIWDSRTEQHYDEIGLLVKRYYYLN